MSGGAGFGAERVPTLKVVDGALRLSAPFLATGPNSLRAGSGRHQDHGDDRSRKSRSRER
jgi:hypothetical protein